MILRALNLPPLYLMGPYGEAAWPWWKLHMPNWGYCAVSIDIKRIEACMKFARLSLTC